jgi:adenylate cyclase
MPMNFFGRTVIVAARIAAEARGGGILVSGLLRELTESSRECTFEAAREVTLKGLAGTQRVCVLVWR